MITTAAILQPAAPPAKPDRASHELPRPEVTATGIRLEPTMSDLQISKRIYALLVGIDAYRPPVPRLDGCVNDIDAFEAFLRERTNAATPDILALRNERATRVAVIAGFREHLAGAKAGDVA